MDGCWQTCRPAQQATYVPGKLAAKGCKSGTGSLPCKYSLTGTRSIILLVLLKYPHVQSLYHGVQEHNNDMAENVMEMKRTMDRMTEMLARMAHHKGIPLSPKPAI